MPKPRRSPTYDPGSRISYLRLQQGLSQEDMARLTGIPLRTYLRIERGETHNPGIRYLANIAMVLGLSAASGIGEVARFEWLEWQVFTEDGPQERPPLEEYPGRFLDPEDYLYKHNPQKRKRA